MVVRSSKWGSKSQYVGVGMSSDIVKEIRMSQVSN